MRIVLTKNMKKIMEWVLQKSVEIKHAINSLQQLELLKIDMEEAMTY
jgi:hypothetical protein